MFKSYFTFFSLLPLFSFAQQPDTAYLIKQQQLQPVEIRAVRAGSKTPFAKTEIVTKEIEKNNLGLDLPYLLQYSPSAVVTSDAGAGVGYTGLRIRGTDGTRINVTLNGIPINDAESQGTFFVDLPDIASSSSSIQIQRGVGTSTNGAGAFGATISVSNLQQMNEAGAEVNVSAGSFNTQKYTLKAGTGLLTGGWQFDARFSKISSDGYMDRSASDLKSLQLLTTWHITDNTNLRLMLLTGNEKTGQAWNGVPEDSLQRNRTFNELGIKSNGSFYDNQTDNYQQDYYQLFLDHKFGENLTATVAGFLTRGKGYYEEYKNSASFSDYGLNEFIVGGDTLTSTDLIRQLWLDNYYYGSVFSLLYEKNKTQLSFGGAFTQYDGNHYGYIKWAEYNVPNDYRWYLLDSKKKDANLYIKAQQRAGNFLFFGDVQFRDVHYIMNGFRDNPSLHPTVNYLFFNPKFGVTFLINERQKAYASIALANKEPNRDDFEAASNALPSPEKLYDAEAGYERNEKHWHASANFYYMKYKNQLVLTGKINDVGAYTRTNVPESYRTGVELAAGASPAGWLRVEANATFSGNKIKNFTEYVDNYDDGTQQIIDHGITDIAFSPNFIAATSIFVSPFRHLSHGQKIELELLNKFIGRQYLDNTSDDKRALKDYQVSDVRIHYTVKTRLFKELTATIALNNIFNNLYESNGYTFSYIYGQQMTTQNYYYPQAGFNWLLGVGLKW